MVNSAVDHYAATRPELGADSATSGVSWAAIFAGAFAAAALSFILVILGFGLGFSSVSPWSGEGLSAQTIGYTTIAWISFTQIAASAIGGYLAGRLRVKWVNLHNDEVYFRDTAHGFLAWAVASLATAALLSSAVGSVISGGAKLAGAAGSTVATAGAAGGVAMAGNMRGDANGLDGTSGYFIDKLLRAPQAPAGDASNGNAAPTADTGEKAVTPAQRMEIARIFANTIKTGTLPDADKVYIAQLLAQRTGITQAEAEKRVSDSYTAYKQAVDNAVAKSKVAADQARKAAAYGALWVFVALLCGAFIASFSATYGGRQRDRVLTSILKTTTDPSAEELA